MSGYLAAGAPIEDFIGWLREYAISNRADERLIAKIDDLYMFQDQEGELETLGGELKDMEEARDDLAEVLQNLLDAIEQEGVVHSPDKQASMEHEAREALKRSGPK